MFPNIGRCQNQNSTLREYGAPRLPSDKTHAKQALFKRRHKPINKEPPQAKFCAYVFLCSKPLYILQENFQITKQKKTPDKLSGVTEINCLASYQKHDNTAAEEFRLSRQIVYNRKKGQLKSDIIGKIKGI